MLDLPPAPAGLRFSPPDSDDWTYHAPTDETAPRYAAIDQAAQVCGQQMLQVLATPDTCAAASAFATITEAGRAFALVIGECAPDSADKSAAMRSLRLARMRANRAVLLCRRAGAGADRDLVAATMQLYATSVLDFIEEASMQANAAIAIGFAKARRCP